MTYEIKDSGSMSEYGSGMRRDSSAGKPKFSLLWPKDIPFEEQLLYRAAVHYTLGGEKYGDRNWEKSSTAEDLAHHEDALERHVHKFLRGVEDGEDHAAAILFNVNAVLLTRYKLKKGEQENPDSSAKEPVHGPYSMNNSPVAVSRVKDCDGDFWSKQPDGQWQFEKADIGDNGAAYMSWKSLLRFWGPVTSEDGALTYYKDDTFTLHC